MSEMKKFFEGLEAKYALPLSKFVEGIPADLLDESIAEWQKNHRFVCECEK